MAEQSLKWTGPAVTEKLRAAQIEGVNRTMAACVNHAKANHSWENQSATLEGGIGIVDYAALNGTGVRGTWGVQDVRYALMMEVGGIIRPKKAKYLAIPLTPEARIAGSPRNMAGLVFVQSLKGQPMLVDEQTGDPEYLLRQSVTIKARPYLRPAADVHYPRLPDAIRKAYQRREAGE